MVTEGRYDLARQGWGAHTHVEADPPSALAAKPGLDKAVFDYVILGGVGYMTCPNWPQNLRGRWLRLEGKDLPGMATPTLDGEPYPLVALSSIQGESVASGDAGVTTLTGRMPVESAAGLLGIKAVLLKQGVDPSELKGSAGFRLTVDKQGRPVVLSLEGRDLKVDSTLPADLRAALPRQSVTVTFERFGGAVTLLAPKKSRLIDPSEMKP
jgi:hypothetical protein